MIIIPHTMQDVVLGGQTNPLINIKNHGHTYEELKIYLKQSGAIGSGIGFLLGLPLDFPGVLLTSFAGSLIGIGIGALQWSYLE